MTHKIDVYLEQGQKRMFAAALDWPGWCRSGRDETSALQALVDYGARYARAIHSAHLGFRAPSDVAAFAIIERLAGNATTDFGAPNVAPASDTRPVDEQMLRRYQALLQACWQAFDAAAESAAGKELRKGPRGGGRDVDVIVQHVLNGEAGYLSRLAWKLPGAEDYDLPQKQAIIRQAVLDAVAAGAKGLLPQRGPRGGVVWAPSYFVRRVAWHVLDHTWEIEDRISLVPS